MHLCDKSIHYQKQRDDSLPFIHRLLKRWWATCKCFLTYRTFTDWRLRGTWTEIIFCPLLFSSTPPHNSYSSAPLLEAKKHSFPEGKLNAPKQLLNYVCAESFTLICAAFSISFTDSKPGQDDCGCFKTKLSLLWACWFFCPWKKVLEYRCCCCCILNVNFFFSVNQQLIVDWFFMHSGLLFPLSPLRYESPLDHDHKYISLISEQSQRFNICDLYR